MQALTKNMQKIKDMPINSCAFKGKEGSAFNYLF